MSSYHHLHYSSKVGRKPGQCARSIPPVVAAPRPLVLQHDLLIVAVAADLHIRSDHAADFANADLAAAVAVAHSSIPNLLGCPWDLRRLTRPKARFPPPKSKAKLRCALETS